MYMENHAYNVFVSIAKCADISSSPGRSFTTETGGSYTVSKFTCDNGYTLDGTISSTCDANGDWTPSLPLCGRYIFLSRVNDLLNKCIMSWVVQFIYL